MAIILFDPELAIARLQDQVVSFKAVSGAADFAAAQGNLKQTPAGFVLPLTDRPGRNLTGTLVVEQNFEVRFGVVLAVQNLRDTLGQKANVDLRTLRIAVMTALFGYSLAADYDPCEYGGGRILQLNDQVLWWQDDYITRILNRSI